LAVIISLSVSLMVIYFGMIKLKKSVRQTKTS
jgi:hypothetical protein